MQHFPMIEQGQVKCRNCGQTGVQLFSQRWCPATREQIRMREESRRRVDMRDGEEEDKERLSWWDIEVRRQDDADYDAEDEQQEAMDLMESGTPEDGEEDEHDEGDEPAEEEDDTDGAV